MKLETFAFDAQKGKWSVPGLPMAMDSDKTLILAFGAPELMDAPAPFKELRRTFPRARLLGCSSAGEIAGTSVKDQSLSVAVARFEHTTLQTAHLNVAS